MSTIITRNSATSGSIPSSLVQGELAINVTDGKLFYGSGSGNVVKEFTGSASGGATNTGSLLTTASFSNPNLTFTKGNGSTFNVNLTSLIPTSASYALTASYASNLVISGSINNVDYIDFTTDNIIGTNAPAWKEGRLFYDSGSGALAMYNWEQDVTLNIGQEQWLRARNQTGTLITNGTVVRLVGAIGDRPTIEPAISSDQTNLFSVDNEIIGMATHDIEHGTDGFVTTFGLVNGIDTSAFNVGDLLWVSQSAGQFTSTPPPPPFDKTFVGIVTRQNANNGTVFMTPLTSIHFHDISSVSASVYQMGDLWMYRSGSVGQANAWINTKALTGSYGISGSLNATSFTGSLLGTASYSQNSLSSSFATTASFATSSPSSGSFGITIDGAGSTITTGNKGHVVIPYNGTITGWTIVADQSGSCVIDVWKANNLIPTSSNTIAGTEKPTLSNQQLNSDTNLTTWTSSISTGDIIAFNVDSATTVTRVNLSISVIKQ
jgi:hypothetical protein